MGSHQKDIEHQLIGIRVAEPTAHLLIRERFNSGSWWTIFGFRSEKRVCHIVADIKKIINAEVETIDYPVLRFGQNSGHKEDVSTRA